MVEPFGFRDGISQPVVEGLPGAAPAAADRVAAGEFVLGYPNEYRLYTDRPLLDPSGRPGAPAAAATRPGRARSDLGRNGTYLVFRQLEQDVAGFWQFVDRASGGETAVPTRRPGTHWPPRSSAGGRAARRSSQAPDRDDPALATSTTSATSTRTRAVCAARSAPTSAGPTRATRSTRSRAARRRSPSTTGTASCAGAASTAPSCRPTRRSTAPDGSTRGLYFACVNANIGRQFEFIQRTWVNNPKFNGLYDDRDPLVASEPGGSFTVPGLPVRNRLTGLPPFVTVTGGAYFFLPGIRAVRYLAALPQ